MLGNATPYSAERSWTRAMVAVKFINFSRFSGSPLDAIARIENHVCPTWRCRLKRYTILCVSDDPYDGGLDRVGDDLPFEDLDAIERLIADRSPFSLTYLAVPTRAEFVIGFHDIEDDGYMITATAESSIFYHKDAHHRKSWDWFEGWLISLITALEPSVCAFGNTSPRPGEIRRLIKYHPHEPRLEYEIAPGYHILSNLR